MAANSKLNGNMRVYSAPQFQLLISEGINDLCNTSARLDDMPEENLFIEEF